MDTITDQRKTSEEGFDSSDIKYKIEIATQTLERNISFVVNCDNKTSIVLAIVGALLTIILTNEGLNEIFCIIKKRCVEITTQRYFLWF